MRDEDSGIEREEKGEINRGTRKSCIVRQL
jgi:hypothetical protein